MSIADIYEQELEQALEVYEAVGDERDKWRIIDEEGANKYMRIVRSIDAQAQEAQEVKRKEVARIEGFYDAQDRRDEQQCGVLPPAIGRLVQSSACCQSEVSAEDAMGQGDEPAHEVAAMVG